LWISMWSLSARVFISSTNEIFKAR
jgi:hypothetical protein